MPPLIHLEQQRELLPDITQPPEVPQMSHLGPGGCRFRWVAYSPTEQLSSQASTAASLAPVPLSSLRSWSQRSLQAGG